MPRSVALKCITTFALGAVASFAATPSIGMASAPAGVMIDGARVSGNATLFEGSQVEATGYSRLQLNSGTRVDLSAGSKIHVYAQRVSLESGLSEVQSKAGYEISARTLTIQPSDANSIARVQLDDNKQVRVTAIGSPVDVRSREGVLVARVMPTKSMSFLPQAGASNSFSNSGCVLNKANVAVFADATGNQVFELRSSSRTVDLRKFVGKRAKITGTIMSGATAAGGASQVVNVTAADAAEGPSCDSTATRLGASMAAGGLAAGGAGAAAAGAGAAAAGAAAAGGAAAAAGVSTAAIVVGGVAAATAAAVGGAAAAGSFSSTSP